jgi:tRNA (guanine37-N1)-methyltransferase
MQIGVVSIFPDMVRTVAEHGVVGRAMERQLAALRIEDPRDYATDTHRTVDDRPYGGGPGMVLKYQPAAEAIRAARAALPEGCPVIYLSPSGRVFDQGEAARLAALRGMMEEVDEELSLGDFVLSGGEIAAMAVIDAVVRLLPGVLGDEDSAAQDSFVEGLLDYPHYTRPEEIEGRRVPAVLLSGDHARIARWRYKQALGRSFLRRPDLVKKMQLGREQKKLLDEFLQEQGRVT